jgi:septal ring factor EnvC (AmiA/AmiB activator)
MADGFFEPGDGQSSVKKKIFLEVVMKNCKWILVALMSIGLTFGTPMVIFAQKSSAELNREAQQSLARAKAEQQLRQQQQQEQQRKIQQQQQDNRNRTAELERQRQQNQQRQAELQRQQQQRQQAEIQRQQQQRNNQKR